MGWVEAIYAALLAIPKIVDGMAMLASTIKQAQLDSIDNKYTKLKEEVNVITKKVELATTNEERLKLVRDLNRI